jgi:NAD(P)-dependent dehydrogenase (short-subunit alcohol dehydrogenase family)
MSTTTIADRVAVVTGASKGIGRATAQRLARAGARVVINARGADELASLEAELRDAGHDVFAFPGNVTRPEGAEQLVAATADRYGPVELLAHTVGVNTTFGPLLETEHGAFMATMERNTWPVVALAQAALQHGMGEGAAIVAVSTIGSHSVQPRVGPYCASKAALNVLVQMLAHELGPRGIRVNAVAPGLVMTEMSRVLWEGDQAAAEAELLPLGRLGEPDDIAGAIEFLLSDDARWTTGQILDVDGGRLLVGQGPAHLIGVHERPATAAP